MKDYWSKISDQYLNSDNLGWGTVLYTSMPLWFNKFFDYFQRKSFNNLIKGFNFQNKKYWMWVVE